MVARAAAALPMAVLTVAFNAVVRQRLQRQADDHLRTRAAAVATTVDTTGPVARVVEVPDDTALDAGVWIYAGPVRIEAPNDAAAGPPAQASAVLAEDGGRRCATVPAHEPVLLCALPVGGPGRAPATVAVALGLAPYRSSADTIPYASRGLDAAGTAGAVCPLPFGWGACGARMLRLGPSAGTCVALACGMSNTSASAVLITSAMPDRPQILLAVLAFSLLQKAAANRMTRPRPAEAAA